MITYNKIKRCKMSLWFLQAIMTQEQIHFRIEKPWPADAKIIRIEFPSEPTAMPSVNVIISSSTFPELNHGDLIPEIEPPIFSQIK